jgi:DNA-binding phage protein
VEVQVLSSALIDGQVFAGLFFAMSACNGWIELWETPVAVRPGQVHAVPRQHVSRFSCRSERSRYSTETMDVATYQSEALDNFILNVRAALPAGGISGLAELTGMSRPYLSGMLRGQTAPSIPNAERIAAALGLSLVELLAPPKKSRRSA